MSETKPHRPVLTTAIVTGTTLLIALGLYLALGRGETATASPLVPETSSSPIEVTRPRIDVVFALDTTGSMDGLIAGAKAKIWSVASKIAAGQPTPDLRIGLVGYRDRGDDYVTRVYPLSRDMDEVHANLMSFSAGGGGDRAEDVIQALQDATHRMQWDRSSQALRIIFLVGDSPAHRDYADQPTLEEVVRTAGNRGITVNTVRCGGASDTQSQWQQIAALTNGGYATVAQSGGWQHVDTPYDGALSKLNARLNETFIAYGTTAEQKAATGRMKMNAALPAPSAAASAGFRARARRLDSHDALSLMAEGRPIEEDKLGGELKGKSRTEQRKILAKKKAEREELNRTIAKVTKKRESYIKKELTKRGGGGMETAVDSMLRTQAKRIGVKY